MSDLYAAGNVPYPPDCADCPTPKECKEKNDCAVLRQIRHPKRQTTDEKAMNVERRLTRERTK